MAIFFNDTFTGSGSIVGHTPDTTYGGLSWAQFGSTPVLTLSGGYATAVGSICAAEFNNAEIDYSQPREFIVDFVFRTGAIVIPNAFNQIFVRSGGIIAEISIYLSAAMTPNTDYPGSIEFYEDFHVINFFGKRTVSTSSFTSSVGATAIAVYLSTGSGIGSLSLDTINLGGATKVYHIVTGGNLASKSKLYDYGSNLSPAVTFPVGTFFGDNFDRVGEVDDELPPISFNGLFWLKNNPPDFKRGYLSPAEGGNYIIYGDVNDLGIGFGLPVECTVAFSIETPAVVNGTSFTVSITVCSVVTMLTASGFNGSWVLFDEDSVNYQENIVVAPNTVYTGSITIKDDLQITNFAGREFVRNVSFANALGFSKVAIILNGIKMNYIYAREGTGAAVDPNLLISYGTVSSQTTAAVATMVASQGVMSSGSLDSLLAISDIQSSGVVRGKPTPLILADLKSLGILTSTTSATISFDIKTFGLAGSQTLPQRYAFENAANHGRLSSSVSYTNSSDYLKSIGIVTSQTYAQRKTVADVVATGVTDSFISQNVNSFNDVQSRGVVSSSSTSHLNATSDVRSYGIVSSNLFYDVLLEAWVMNAKTKAMSRYNGLLYKSVAVISDRVIALGDTGFFELDAQTDEAVPVKSKAVTGMAKLGTLKLKRLGNIFLGYTTDKPVSFTVQEYGDNKAAYTYALPSRLANAPRAGKIKLGGGLRSQYYQFTIEGQSLNLDYAEVEVFSSDNRKV